MEEEEKKRLKRAKKDALKAKGLWLSKKEKIRKDEADRLREQLIQSGVIKSDDIKPVEE